jgi:hypothetical protein
LVALPSSPWKLKLFPDFYESVIPECFYRESRRNHDWTPDKNFRGDNSAIKPFWLPVSFLRGNSFKDGRRIIRQQTSGEIVHSPLTSFVSVIFMYLAMIRSVRARWRFINGLDIAEQLYRQGIVLPLVAVL